MCQHCDSNQQPLPFIAASELPHIAPVEHAADASIRCAACRNAFPADACIESEDGEQLCEECRISCEGCSRTFRSTSSELEETYENNGRSVNSRSGEFRCEDCRERCADCENYFTELDSHNTSGERICARCAENYYTCESCDCIIHSDDSRLHNDQTLCQECYEREAAEEDEDEQVTEPDDDGLHDYSYKPSPIFLIGSGETKRPKLYLGVEIEVENRARAFPIASAVAAVGDGAFYCKRDSSIDNGFEIVSHPCSWAWWKDSGLKFCDKLRDNGYRSYDTTTCGMHVHVSKAALSEVERVKLLLFFRENPVFIRFISRRKGDLLSKWASVEEKRISQFIYKVQYGNSHDERYVALNCENENTIEFRIFRGTLDIASIKRNLAFVVAMCHYVKGASHSRLTAEDFRQWIARDGKSLLGEYQPILLKWIAKYQTTHSLTVEERESA